MPSALRAFFNGLIDYAGLYPPAALPMDQAVHAYAEALRGPDGWVLNRMVVPSTRLDSFAQAFAELPPDRRGPTPWPITVTAGPDIMFCASVADEFAARQPVTNLRVDAVETLVRTPEEIERARAAVAPAVGLVLELPLDADLPALARAVKEAGGVAKLRAGGIHADDIPTPTAVVGFLGACAAERLPFKATAGLHHAVRGPAPLTYAPGAERAVMHGYLNVLLAAVALWGGRSAAEALGILEDDDRDAFQPGAEALRWRALRFGADEIARARNAFVTAVGSCSFAEPLQEIRQLGAQLAGPA